MGERTGDRELDRAPGKSSASRWGLAFLGAFLGAVTCGVGYWPATVALRDALDVPHFPPSGGTYWMCWWLPVAVTVGLAAVLLFPRSSRSFAAGFILGLVVVAAAMCAFGYSVDAMPYYM
ncbi:hypothetical protein [Rhodococcus sp. SGAir0479]|uniref:hypothetical protein n=1 Tax=Rhodococcus sp. SGAir0479 TaxID=2567884 RepID=UPI0010CD1261|nr:hypothetical protein [Rhodococcus sp. SGAir0479]QCQ91002.1 hypothetical protein E7742_06935 [Rhodococcus sp. SGAir0479]